MTAEVETYHIKTHENNFALTSQQTTSIFENHVSQGVGTGSEINLLDTLGEAKVRRQESRGQSISYNDTPSGRRWCAPLPLADTADSIEKDDQVKSLIDFSNGYAQSHVAALKRDIDEVIVEAAFGPAIIGKNPGPTVEFDSNQVVGADVGANQATGANYDKLVALVEMFTSNKIKFEEEGTLYWAIGSKQNSNLLKQAEFIKKEYQIPVFINQMHQVERMGGIQFLHYTDLPVDGNGYRRTFAFVKKGLHLRTWKPMQTSVMPDMTKVGHPWQVYSYHIIGATRVDEKKVAEIKCAE